MAQNTISDWKNANDIGADITCVPDARVKIGAEHHPVIVERLQQEAKEAKKRKPKSEVGKIPQQNAKTRDKVAKIARRQQKLAPR